MPYLGQAREALTASPGVVFGRKNSVWKRTERTRSLYKNSLHLALAPVVGSVQAGAGLQAWSEINAMAPGQIVKPRHRFRCTFPLTSGHSRMCFITNENIAERSKLSIRRHEGLHWHRLRFSPTAARANQIEIRVENAASTLLDSFNIIGAALPLAGQPLRRL